MRIYKTKSFSRFQRRETIDDDALKAAVQRIERGLKDADLGQGLVKQRVARKGQGRSGGYRTIVAYKRGDKAIYLFGFAKNERANIGVVDVKDLADFAAMLFKLDESDWETMLREGR